MHRRLLRTGERAVGAIGRRALLLGATAAAVASPARRADADEDWRPRSLDLRAIRVDGTQSRLFVLATPNHLASWERVPLVVLLHGLGECDDERAGAWAWLERYGLGTSYDRLLAAGSMRGLAFACPYMPNLPIAEPGAFDAYARWLAETVVPRARRDASMAFDEPVRTHLGGCSLGGHFSLEVLLRRPEAFGAWAGVQTAVSAAAGERYAARLAQAGPRPVMVETSTEDPFRAGNEAIDRALTRAGMAHAFAELPGPHDQPWLRRSGTARMLQWLDELPRPEPRPPPPVRPAASG